MVLPPRPREEVPKPKTPSSEASGRRARVFVVEDERLLLDVVRDALVEVAGYEVEHANRASGTPERVARFRPDLVLMDLVLPDATGVVLLEAIRAVEGAHRVPAIGFTGAYPSVEDARAAHPQFDDFLIKPVGIDRLLETVERWLPAR
jgi:DNA-binding response OmpR family regulator